MKMNKEKFLKTELGAEMKNCIDCWDLYLNKDFTVFNEITEILQIEKYLRIHGTEIKRSLRDAKQEELQDKSSNVVILLETSLKQSEIFVKGSKVNIIEKNVKDRIDDALEDLISKVYHKLKYMDFAPDKSDIIATIKEYSQETLASGESKSNNALNDVDDYIKTQSKNKYYNQKLFKKRILILINEIFNLSFTSSCLFSSKSHSSE